VTQFNKTAIPLFAVFFVLGFSTAPVWSQGYEGLIPDSKPAASDNTMPKGYEGLIPGAPAMPEKPRAAATRPAVTPKGADGTAANMMPQALPKSMAPIPTNRAQAYDNAIARLQHDAQLSDMGISFGNIPANSSRMDLNAIAANTRMLRIGGLTPLEFMVKRQIATTMATLNNPSIPAVQKKDAAQKSYTLLSFFQKGLAQQKAAQEKITFGQSKTPLLDQDKKEATVNSIKRIDQALAELQKYTH
jgi:hypothetical protein